jgi:hypothetical protein
MKACDGLGFAEFQEFGLVILIIVVDAQTILCGIGSDVSRFRNASAGASWPGSALRRRSAAVKWSSIRADNVAPKAAPALIW